MRRSPAALALVLLPGEAAAHAFQSGAGAYEAFLEGAGVPLGDARQVVALVAAALLITLPDPQGLPKAWLLLLAGMAAGLILAPLAPPQVSAAVLAAAALLALLAAAAPPLPRLLPDILAATACCATTALALEGHGFGSLPWPIFAGVLLGANLALAVPAALASMALTRLPPAPARIGLRIAASWCAAIAVMLLAFELR